MQLITTNSPVGNRGTYRLTREPSRRNPQQQRWVSPYIIDRAAFHYFCAVTKSGPYVIPKLVTVYVRRGDYEAHCKWLGYRKAPWNGWNSLSRDKVTAFNAYSILDLVRFLRLLSSAQQPQKRGYLECGSSKVSLVFCSCSFSVTREQQSNFDGPFFLQPLTFAHSSQPNE